MQLTIQLYILLVTFYGVPNSVYATAATAYNSMCEEPEFEDNGIGKFYRVLELTNGKICPNATHIKADCSARGTFTNTLLQIENDTITIDLLSDKEYTCELLFSNEANEAFSKPNSYNITTQTAISFDNDVLPTTIDFDFDGNTTRYEYFYYIVEGTNKKHMLNGTTRLEGLQPCVNVINVYGYFNIPADLIEKVEANAIGAEITLDSEKAGSFTYELNLQLKDGGKCSVKSAEIICNEIVTELSGISKVQIHNLLPNTNYKCIATILYEDNIQSPKAFEHSFQTISAVVLTSPEPSRVEIIFNFDDTNITYSEFFARVDNATDYIEIQSGELVMLKADACRKSIVTISGKDNGKEVVLEEKEIQIIGERPKLRIIKVGAFVHQITLSLKDQILCNVKTASISCNNRVPEIELSGLLTNNKTHHVSFKNLHPVTNYECPLKIEYKDDVPSPNLNTIYKFRTKEAFNLTTIPNEISIYWFYDGEDSIKEIEIADGTDNNPTTVNSNQNMVTLRNRIPCRQYPIAVNGILQDGSLTYFGKRSIVVPESAPPNPTLFEATTVRETSIEFVIELDSVNYECELSRLKIQCDDDKEAEIPMWPSQNRYFLLVRYLEKNRTYNCEAILTSKSGMVYRTSKLLAKTNNSNLIVGSDRIVLISLSFLFVLFKCRS